MAVPEVLWGSALLAGVLARAFAQAGDDDSDAPYATFKAVAFKLGGQAGNRGGSCGAHR